MKKINILWIMTDQHRADCLGFMGHPVIQTPHLDRLAATGVVFENAFCQSPVCMASRASLFTGRYPTTIRVRGMGILPPQEMTFPEILGRNGFHTGAFGKLHLTPELYTRDQIKSDSPILDWHRFAKDAELVPIPDDPFKENYGFQYLVACEDVLQGAFQSWLLARNPELSNRTSERLTPDDPADLFVSPYPSPYHPTTFIAEKAAEFILGQNNEKPWFTFCSFIAPHHPFEAPADQLARYRDVDVPLPQCKGGVEPTCIPDQVKMAIGEMDQYPEEVQRRIVGHYLASISLIDDGVGRLVAALEQSGQMENTIIMFTADHGEFLGNHGLLRKPSLHYDETLRVPLMIHLPGGKACRRIPGLVELTDVYPTMLGLLGVVPNSGLQGMDWSPQLHSGGDIGRPDIYSDMFDLEPQRFGNRFGPYAAVLTLRTEQWKLNLYPTAGAQYGQLFNLQDDPDESCNRYTDESCRAVREDLLWRLIQRQHLMTDPLPLCLTQF